MRHSFTALIFLARTARCFDHHGHGTLVSRASTKMAADLAHTRDINGVYAHLKNAYKIDLSYIEVKESPGMGCGIYAIRNIPSDEVVLKIPLEYCIYPEMVLKDPDVGAAADQYIDEAKNQPSNEEALDAAYKDLLPLFLVKEFARGSDSPFYAYIQSLPWGQTETYILDWSPTELNLLQGSSYLEELSSSQKRAKTAASRIFEMLPKYVHSHFGEDLPEVIKDAFFLSDSRVAQHAWTIEEAERLNIKHEDQPKTLLLAPLFDLMNNDITSPSCQFGTYVSRLDSGLAIKTQRGVAAGEELHFSYGHKPNWQLLRHYDFVDDQDSSCWKARVNLTVDKTDSLAQLKAQILEDNSFVTGNPDSQYIELGMMQTGSELEIGPTQLAQLRILAIETEEELRAAAPAIFQQAYVEVRRPPLVTPPRGRGATGAGAGRS